MKKIEPVKFPFDLPAIAERYTIYTPPRIVATMLLEDKDGGSDVARSTAALLAQVVTQLDTNKYGFTLPHRYGQTDAEKRYAQKAFSSALEFQAASLEMVAECAEIRGQSLQEIQAIAATDPEFMLKDPRLTALVAKQARAKLESDDNKASYDDHVVTAFMRRILPAWGIANTTALHSKILEQLYEFANAEEQLAQDAFADEELEDGEAQGPLAEA
jgi:hypothetical protein